MLRSLCQMYVLYLSIVPLMLPFVYHISPMLITPITAKIGCLNKSALSINITLTCAPSKKDLISKEENLEVNG